MKIKSGLWVVVADGKRGVILVNEGNALHPDLKALRVYEQENPKTSEQGRDQPPKVFQSIGARRSSMASADLHRRAEDKFVDQIINDLTKEASANAFEFIVIVAPPTAIGEMRKHSKSDALNKKILAWIDKDLTHHSIPDITIAVAKILES